MFISEIKKDKKHLTRLLLSSGEEILIDNDLVSEKGLSEGTEIDEEFLNEIKYQSDYKRAKARALWYLDRMDYTEKKLYEKLVKAGFGKKAAASVLAWCVEFGLVDDRRFAERFAERSMDNNISKREAVQKMLLKGVPLSLAKEVIEELECDEESQIAELLAKKYAYKLSSDNGPQKVFASLARKGFSFGAIKSALKKYNEELEFCED